MLRFRAGLRVLARVANSTWQIAGVTLVLIVVADLIAAALIHASLKPNPLGSAEAQIKADGGTPWAKELYREESELSATWYPYVYWRSSPIDQPYIHVDVNGLRLTFNGATRASGTPRKPFKIFMFGGSTMFGLGARDDETIPSLLAKGLEHDGITNVQITNFGQIGYVSTQEVIALSEQLRLANIPDLVIFYDGINDSAASYQNGVAGVPQNEFNRAREFNLLNQADSARRKALYSAAGIVFVEHTALGELARIIVARYTQPLFNRMRDELPFARARVGMEIHRNWDVGNEPAALPKETVESYLKNMALVQAEGEKMGFASFFYWQPDINSKPHRSALESSFLRAADKTSPGMEKFMRATYAYARSAAERLRSPRIYDMSKIFAGVRGTCFVDLFHITGNCNAIVAARMERDVLPLVEYANSQARTRRVARPGSLVKIPTSPPVHAVPAIKHG